jgi:hypothetical protein
MNSFRCHPWTRQAAVFTVLLAIHSAGRGQNAAQKILAGDTKVTVISEYKGKDKLPAPTQIIIHDFDVPSEIITIDRSPAAHLFANSPIARRKGDAGEDEDPAAVARKVQAAFSKRLLSDLKTTSIPAEVTPLGANPDMPVDTLNVRGDFTTVKQGNKTARIMIGLGRGASDVQAHVMISLLTANGPLLLSEFNVSSASGKKPGAVETMGVGSAAGSVAASGAVDGKATVEGDTSRIANAVAKELRNIMAAQQWIPGPGAEKQTEASATQTPR